MAPAPRGAYEVVQDFTAATERLARIAADWRQSQFRAGDLSDAAHTLEGLARLLAELRQEAHQ
jgi:hypothetical protein